MPMCDFRCDACGETFERFFHPSEAGAIDKRRCECGAIATRYFEYKRPHSYAGLQDAVVLHQDVDGHYLVPAHKDAPVPPGCTKVEFRSVQEIRRVEQQMNAHERGKWERQQEREQAAFAEEHGVNRGELIRRMGTMSNKGRDLARLAIEQGNNRPARRYRGEVHFEAFSMDASNREAGRDDNHRLGRK